MGCNDPSTYKLFILVFKSSCKTGTFHACSNGKSKYFNCFLTNILLRSEGFTEQSFAIQNKPTKHNYCAVHTKPFHIIRWC